MRAIFVLLTGESLLTPVDKPVLRFTTVFPELISGFIITDHQLAARGLARGLGLAITEGASWNVKGADGSANVAFDAQGRLAKIDGRLG